jgi:hypothetical protein
VCVRRPCPGDGWVHGEFESRRVVDGRSRVGLRSETIGSSNIRKEVPVTAAHSAADEDEIEPCESCGRETPHEVRIEIRTDSTKRENAEFSREPYRVATCVACGDESVTRMNNA